jgi:hypothetical protein
VSSAASDTQTSLISSPSSGSSNAGASAAQKSSDSYLKLKFQAHRFPMLSYQGLINSQKAIPCVSLADLPGMVPGGYSVWADWKQCNVKFFWCIPL